MTRTVVITGASAGIGRATALLCGEMGDNVGLLARGRAGLEGAVADVEKAGGKALAVAADVADYDQVKEAARQIEEAFGPIDVWVNVAFTSVFAPFWEIAPEEFRRVTEVSYLGFVHGTRVALDLMRPRDRGTIVQVGSALALRSIPLQSAYCGAKHAIDGFTSSLRTELMHEHSNVRVTVVQMPAVNTPQFSWVLSRLPNHPQPVPPIYQPELAARAVLYAADHPVRKQYWAGDSTAVTILANKFVAPLLDRYLARTGFKAQQTDQKVDPDRPHNLWEPVDGEGGRDHGSHGEFDARAHHLSPELWVSHHARTMSAVVGVAVGASAVIAAKFLGRSEQAACERISPVRKRMRHRSAIPRLAAALSWARAGLGARDLLFPGLAAGSPAGRPHDRGARSIVRVLGARQVAQAVVTDACPTAAVLKLGAEIDVAHAASMVTLALCSRRWRRDALADAVINAAFAMVGLGAAHSRSRRGPPVGLEEGTRV